MLHHDNHKRVTGITKSLMHNVEKGCHFAVWFVTDQRWFDRYGWIHEQWGSIHLGAEICNVCAKCGHEVYSQWKCCTVGWCYDRIVAGFADKPPSFRRYNKDHLLPPNLTEYWNIQRICCLMKIISIWTNTNNFIFQNLKLSATLT